MKVSSRHSGSRDAGAALRMVQDAVDDGEDPRQLNRQLLAYLRLLLIERSGGTGDADARARELAGMFSLSELAALGAPIWRDRLHHQARAIPATPARSRARRGCGDRQLGVRPEASRTNERLSRAASSGRGSRPARHVRRRCETEFAHPPPSERCRRRSQRDPTTAEPATITPLRSVPVAGSRCHD